MIRMFKSWKISGEINEIGFLELVLFNLHIRYLEWYEVIFDNNKLERKSTIFFKTWDTFAANFSNLIIISNNERIELES